MLSVTVTLYIVVEDGHVDIADVVAPVFHENEYGGVPPLPLAVMVVQVPEHIVAGVMPALKLQPPVLITFTTTMVLPVQPVAVLVPVTV